VVAQGVFDRSLTSHIFFNILHINAFINELQKLYFIYLLYFTIKIGITGTIILKIKVKINKNNLIERMFEYNTVLILF